MLAEVGRPLPTRFPPPTYPPGWAGTAVSGDPAEYAERIGWPWPDPLAFWSDEWESEDRRLRQVELDRFRKKGREVNAERAAERRRNGKGSQHPSWMTGPVN
jgi:hypothetical protein